MQCDMKIFTHKGQKVQKPIILWKLGHPLWTQLGPERSVNEVKMYNKTMHTGTRGVGWDGMPMPWGKF